MEVYPIEYTAQLGPLIFVQGLGKDGIPQGSTNNLLNPPPSAPIINNPLLIDGELIRRDSQTIRCSYGLELVSLFNQFNLANDCIWDNDLVRFGTNSNSISSGSGIATTKATPSDGLKFRFKFIDSELLLPQAKESSAANSSGSNSNNNSSATNSESLESDGSSPVSSKTTYSSSFVSPLSPFNESSDLYPDGILSANWIQKYRDITPAVFVSVHELDGDLTDKEEISKSDNEIIKEINYLKLHFIKRNIKFLSIVVCSRSILMNPELNERINNLRKATNLNAKNVLSTLSNAEDLKNIPKELIQPFYEARYDLKLSIISELKLQHENSVKLYELAYVSMVKICSTIPMKHTRWQDLRMLLDYTAFNIVKLYLYLQNCNLSYTKFDIHIQNVLLFLKKHNVSINKNYWVISWLSYQFQWLGELLEFVPDGIVPVDNALSLRNSDNDLLQMPNGGYIFLQANSLLKRRKIQASKYQNGNNKIDIDDTFDSYLSLLPEDEVKFDYFAKSNDLLEKSLRSFSRSEYLKFNRTIINIHLEMGENFFQLQKYEMSIINFEKCLELFNLNNLQLNWYYLLSIIYLRLYQSYYKMEKKKEIIFYLLKLSSLEGKYSQNHMEVMESETKFDKKFAEPVVFDEKQNFFTVEFLFKESSTPISACSKFQLKLTSNLNELLGTVKVKEIVITFKDDLLMPIILKHSEEMEMKKIVDINNLKEEQDTNLQKNVLIGYLNLNFSATGNKNIKYLQFTDIVTTKLGTTSLLDIDLLVSYKELVEVKFKPEIQLDKVSNRYEWLILDKDNNSKDNEKDDYNFNTFFLKKRQIIKTYDPLFTSIVPRKPDTKILLDYDHNRDHFYIGELIHFNISVINNDSGNVSLNLKSTINLNDENEDTNVESYWEDSTSDEIYLESLKSNNSKVSKKLFIKIPNILEKDKNFLHLKIAIKFFVNDNMNLPVEDSVVIKNIPILRKIFNLTFSVAPRYIKEDNMMPSPFIIHDGDAKLPKPVRLWCGKSSIRINTLDIKVKEIKLVVNTSDNDEYICELVENNDDNNFNEDEQHTIIHKKNFKTLSKTGNIHRNIPIEAKLIIYWSRKSLNDEEEEDGNINEYFSPLWKVSLPLSDPRVLLNIKKIIENGNDNILNFKYILENPTPRIFQFSSSLIYSTDVQDDDEGKEKIQMISDRGDVKNQTFPVLPFTRQVLNYYGLIMKNDKFKTKEGNSDDDWIKLPVVLKIYDLNYKIYLPTLISNDSLQIDQNGDVFYRSQSL
ncbi:hypothetical protein PACTADRAFT_4148 [Pachysolen tannophilus NRRL Y-2460]|uniref:Trafficking protein particle complex subunit 11 domain-containing protein n=1 Tax=Pachysolen tannophilus NRRL Y-2460 TaxID=669874 RepID=A0A1E4TR93_PACTA|nr:hypothetical protein PACTADRAFT_4148 [Pachysolen tannophilus NRRL Y-2460]